MPAPLFSNSGWDDNEDRKDSGVARGYQFVGVRMNALHLSSAGIELWRQCYAHGV